MIWKNTASLFTLGAICGLVLSARQEIMGRREFIIFPLLVFVASGQQGTFKVFQNTLDLSDFGLISGAILNASGSGYVDGVTLCMRFQVNV